MAAWTPGFRRTPPGQSRKVRDHVIAVFATYRQKIGVYTNPPSKEVSDVEDDTPNEPGENIVISFDNGYKKYGINLSDFTEEELLAWWQAVGVAVSWALPIVKNRDRVAREAAENGNDIFYRRHRPAPKLSIFKRQVGQHDQGVPDGPEDVLAGDGPEPSGP